MAIPSSAKHRLGSITSCCAGTDPKERWKSSLNISHFSRTLGFLMLLAELSVYATLIPGSSSFHPLSLNCWGSIIENEGKKRKLGTKVGLNEHALLQTAMLYVIRADDLSVHKDVNLLWLQTQGKVRVAFILSFCKPPFKSATFIVSVNY